MGDMDALERQVADVARLVVGPPRSIDALAIARAAAAKRPAIMPRPVFGTVRFLAAGAVIALFGGLLVFGLSTTPSDERSVPGAAASGGPTRSPEAEPTAQASLTTERTTRSDVLAGATLVTEEVEPGVLRVVSDGVRELSRPSGLVDYDVFDSRIAAGRDGSVWIFTIEGFVRLGTATDHAWGRAQFGTFEAPSVAPDGRLWLLDGDVLRSFDGTRWSVELRGANGLHVWPDGTTWTRDLHGNLLRLEDGSWTNMHAEAGSERTRGGEAPGQIWVSPRIDPAVEEDLGVEGRVQVLARAAEPHPDGRELGVSLIASGEIAHGGAGALPAEVLHFDMTDAGDWWIYQTLDVPEAGGSIRRALYLVRVQGGIVTRVITDEQGVRSTRIDGGASMEAAPDGSVWMTVRGGPEGGSRSGCDGVRRFDGERWSQFLRDTCVYDFDPAPDGSVWLLAGTEGVRHSAVGSVETYVIRPEAIPAAE